VVSRVPRAALDAPRGEPSSAPGGASAAEDDGPERPAEPPRRPGVAARLGTLTQPLTKGSRARSELVAGATMAAGVAVMLAVLVVVAIVGVVGGLGIGIALANVVG